MLRNKLDIFIRISLCACILCGCEQMRGIRRESIDNSQKLVNENNELINEIQINKKITLDEKEIKRLIEEKEELRNNQEKECPMLYTFMFSNSWIDQNRARRAWYRIQCNDWVSRELEKEDQRHKTATPEITEENQSKICPIAGKGLTPVTNNFSFPDKISYARSVHLWEEYHCEIWYRMINSW